MLRDAQAGQAEAGRRNASNVAGIRSARLAAVFGQARVRIHLVPEKLKAGSFKLFQKLVFLGSKTVLGRIFCKKGRAAV